MMYQKLTSDECKMIERVSKETSTEYEIEGDFILTDSFICMIEDMLVEVEHLKEIIEDLEEEKGNSGEQDWDGIGKDIKFGVM